MSSGWFDLTETFLSTSLKGKQGVQGAYALVRGGSSTSNLHEPLQRCTANLIEPTRNHIITEIARCREVCHMSSGWFDFSHISSGWFDCTEPSLSTSLQGKQGVQGAYA